MKEYEGLVEPYILSEIEDFSAVYIKKQKPRLTRNRFDLAFKLIYLEFVSEAKKSNFRRHCYKEHIKAFSLGRYNEPYDDEKTHFEIFERVFIELHCSYKKDGFDEEKSLIPLANDGSIINGAHRCSLSIYLNLPVVVINTGLPPANYDYKFFKNRGVPPSVLDFAAQTFADYDETCYLAFVWPAAKGFSERIDAELEHVVYKKFIHLNQIGAHNLLSEVYCNEPWIGNKEKNYPGIYGKYVECFPSLDTVKVYLFQGSSINHVLKIKEKIRSIFKIGKHAIHITDTPEETRHLSRLVFNNNSLHFLNNAHPNKFPAFNLKINYYKNEINRYRVSLDDYILDSGMVMAAYGIRDANDIDYLTTSLKIKNDLMEHHRAELKHHCITEVDLVDDPANHFFYQDVKLVSLQQLYNMKGNRYDNKDQKDILQISELIGEQTTTLFLYKWACSTRFFLAKFKNRTERTIAIILKRTGLFNITQKIYRKLFR